jgi:hypothetical protein
VNADQVLETALSVIRDREKTHGSKRQVFDQTRRLWSAYLGIPVDAAQVATMMALLKIARSQCGEINHDDLVDACGYAAIASELRQ